MLTLLYAALPAAIGLCLGFIAGRYYSSLRNIIRKRSGSGGKMPMWLKSCTGDHYTKLVYDKLCDYFKNDSPYLDSRLSIEDVAQSIGTNKSYVAKSIRMYSGHNFCQFVNSYRVDYAISLHKREPELKVMDLAYRSGFNSSTAFSISFKLAKGIPPGEWLRLNDRMSGLKKVHSDSSGQWG